MTKPLPITEHAFRRAEDRMDMTRDQFARWVESGRPNWVQVNAGYLRDHNLICSQFSTHYVTPWQDGLSVALCVSPDKVLVTIMVFRERRPIHDG